MRLSPFFHVLHKSHPIPDSNEAVAASMASTIDMGDIIAQQDLRAASIRSCSNIKNVGTRPHAYSGIQFARRVLDTHLDI